jgi:hypothetical protein
VAACIAAMVAPALAAPAIRVEAQACPGVDGREVERLLAIELGALAPPGSIDVSLACTAGRLRMTARDPVLDRQLVRDVAIGPPEEGRDRTIALLVSQLFLTSWAEEFLEHPGPRPPAPPPPAARAAPAPLPPVWELQIEAGVRLRDWAAPAPAEQISAMASRRAGPLRLVALAGLERGSADRAAGSAVWTIGGLGAGVAWGWAGRGRLGAGGALLGSAGLARVHGDPATTASSGETVSGLLGQVVLVGGPRLVWSNWRVGLELEVGATFPGATAHVAGDRDVKLSGPWAGAGLSLAWGRP